MDQTDFEDRLADLIDRGVPELGWSGVVTALAIALTAARDNEAAVDEDAEQSDDCMLDASGS